MQIQNGMQTSVIASVGSGTTDKQQGLNGNSQNDMASNVSDDTLSLSKQATTNDSAQARAIAKYEMMLLEGRAYSTVVAPQPEQETEATTLDGLPPIKLFNADDVAAYEESLSVAFAKAGVDTSQEIDLAIDYQGNVYVKNDHPDKDKIEAVFKEQPELQQGLIQAQNFYLFNELYQLTQQWAQKVDSGMSEAAAGQWLLSASKQAQAVSSNGITFKEGGMVNPFERSHTNSVAMQAYAG